MSACARALALLCILQVIYCVYSFVCVIVCVHVCVNMSMY